MFFKEYSKNILVLGNGAWAVTIANHICKKTNKVLLWCHRAEKAKQLNTSYYHDKLPNITLEKNLEAVYKLNEIEFSSLDAIIICLPSQYLSQVISQVKPYINEKIPILNLTKGIVAKKHILIHDFIFDQLGKVNYSVLSGPNLAIEIAQGKPAAAVVASKETSSQLYFQSLLSHKNLRIYRSSDIVGVSCGGILKNIIAIAAGCIDALELGNNTKATLITRSLAEMITFGDVMGAKRDTFYGLSGVGDLIATCSTSLSRNYKCGYSIAKGKSLEAFQQTLNAVAEGIQTTKLVYEYAKENKLSMPITTAVYDILFNQRSIDTVINQLMTRELKIE